jgi:DNA recombination protein RmuC
LTQTLYAVGGLIALFILLQIVSLWVFLSRRSSSAKADAGGVAALQRQMESLERSLGARMHESSRSVQSSMMDTTRLIAQITAEITSVKEIGRETGKFAEQLKQLQDILRHPKQRGVLGEYFLETVLKNVFPPDSFKMQYAFKSGEAVDAAVIIGDKIVPVDSKFSLENYNRFVEAADAAERAAYEKAFVSDLKLRIDETAKYIRPAEGTLDFAFMFIPSEGIYYDLLTNRVGTAQADNLMQQAAAKKVIIVSPTSFLAYLHTVMQGLRALKIEKKALEIEARVGELGRHMSLYQEHFRKLGAALGTTVAHYNSGAKELGRIDKDVLRITGEQVGGEVALLEKPSESV